ncbi:putative reverse transcriptase domain-containing protein [Tanacetum coccineum]
MNTDQNHRFITTSNHRYTTDQTTASPPDLTPTPLQLSFNFFDFCSTSDCDIPNNFRSIRDTYPYTYYNQPSLDYTPASPDYSPASDLESDPSEDPSSDHIPPLPDISPFLSLDDDPTDSDTPDTPSSPTHDTPFTEITTFTQRSPIIPHQASSDFHSDASSDSSSRHSLLDHSSPDLPSTSAGPSRKRHRSPMASVLALPLVSGALSPVHADLVPSPKRVRDSGYLADVEVDPRETSLRDDVLLIQLNDMISPDPVISDVFIMPYGKALYLDSETIGVLNLRLPRIFLHREPPRGSSRGYKRTFKNLVTEVSIIHIDVRAIPASSSKMPNTRSGASMTHEEFEELVTRRVAKEMEAREAARTLEPLNENGDEQEGENGGNGNGGNGENGNGGNGHRNGNHGMNYGGFMPVARECTFQDFLKCKPHNFSGTEGVVRLTRWFEKMEIVFNISNCPLKYQVKYATCTLQDSALTWWNSHKRTIGVEAAYAMNWVELMKLMTEVYCPRNEIQKMETELWNLTVKGNDLTAYTQRFQELILLCTRMVPDEEDRVERFIGGLPDNIQGNVIAANPARLQDAIRNNERRGYDGPLPYCNKCRLHHEGLCTMRCGNCKKVGHQTRELHFRRDCPKLRSQNHGNQTRNKNGNKTGNQTRGNKTMARAYAIGGGGINPDSNVVTSTFLLQASMLPMLFDFGSDRCFVSTTFSALLDVTPTTLDTSYAIELADGKEFRKQILL